FGSRQLHFLSERDDVRGRDVPEGILDAMQVFNEKIGTPGRVAQDLTYLGLRVRIDLAALGLRPRATSLKRRRIYCLMFHARLPACGMRARLMLGSFRASLIQKIAVLFDVR